MSFLGDYAGYGASSDTPVFIPPTTTTGPSGLSTVSNAGPANQNTGSQTNTLLEIQTGGQRSRNLGLGLNIRDTDTNFEREINELVNSDRDMDTALTEALLTQEQCDRIEACILQIQTQICGKSFTRLSELEEKADKIFEQACGLEAKLLENVQCQIEAAKCQFFRAAASRWSTVARAVGSSRNTFVITQQNIAMVDLTRKLAALRAELQNSAILQAHTNLQSAYSAQIAARDSAFNSTFSQMISLWGLIRGAKRTLNEHKDDTTTMSKGVTEDSFQDVTTFDWSGKFAASATQSDTAAGAYTNDYNNLGLQQAILGIISP